MRDDEGVDGLYTSTGEVRQQDPIGRVAATTVGGTTVIDEDTCASTDDDSKPLRSKLLANPITEDFSIQLLEEA